MSAPPCQAAPGTRWRTFGEQTQYYSTLYEASFVSGAFWEGVVQELAHYAADDVGAITLHDVRDFCFMEEELFPTAGNNRARWRELTRQWKIAWRDESARERCERTIGREMANCILQSGAGDARFYSALRAANALDTVIAAQMSVVAALREQRRALVSTRPTLFWERVDERVDAARAK